jgi:cellulose synthase/poly-beta-1,6-N-acetylglucosamine synthase-like glycosyltransferase
LISVTAIYVAILGAVSLAYGLVLLGFVRGIRALRRGSRIEQDPWPSVSVILPARNEAEVVERTVLSLLDQDYAGDWKILVVDDRSTDHTPDILARLAGAHKRLSLLTVTKPFPQSPKKNALAMGIRESRGEIIVTTDADCEYDPGWLTAMVSHMTDDVGVVAGLTVFDLPVEHVPAWQKIQWLDFAAQQFLAAGAIGAGVPSSCNGSNLAYRRSVYDEISGFGNSAAIVSGDDVLFAQRVAKLTHWKVAYATEPESVVRSLPVLTVGEMFYQRIRWASKGLAYRRSMMVFLTGMYLYYAMWVAAPLVIWYSPKWAPAVLGIAAWKLAWDYLTVRLGCRMFGLSDLLPYFPPFVVLHTILSPVFGISGLVTPYRWKGEWYRTAKLPKRWKRSLVRVRRIVRQHRVARSAT